MNQLDLFYDNLPQKPYCTDDLGNLLIRPAASAIKRRYIQPNKPTDLKWLVYDIDRPTAYFDWYDLKAPNPNIVVMNRDNGHAHLFYGLEVPVYKQPSAQQKPLRYAASVDVALAKKLDADPGYAGLICKNPHHKSWEVGIFESVSYDLNWLADYVDLDPFYDRRKHLPPVGLGRNCTLFDVTRHWSYRQIRKPQGWLSESFFVEAVIEYAYSYNLTFPCPLPSREVKATGKSIGKWTFRNMSAEGFRSWGENRRRASIRVRSASAQEKANQVKEYKRTHPEATTRAIADVFGISQKSVSNYLR